MRRLPIRTKLAVALAVPLLALVAVTVLEVVKTSSEVDDVREQTELAQAAIGPSGIITALQNERTWLAVELIGQQDGFEVPVRGYDETRSQTDEAISAFREDIAAGSATVREVFQDPLAGLDALAEVRADIDGSTAPRSPDNIEFAGEIFDRYTELIRPFFSATTRISLAVDDPTLRQGTELADAAAREIEALSVLLRTVIVDSTLSEGGIDESAEIARIATLHSDFQSYADVLRNGTGPYARLVREEYPEALVASVNEQIDSALTTGSVDLGTVLAAVNVPRDQAFTGYQDSLHALIVDRAEELQTAAENRRVWFGALAMLALGVAVVLTWLVSRSITRPLRSLTEQAKEMASHRLPDAVLDILETPLGDDVDVPEVEPITVRTRDEVADVADALNTVQDSALDLAVEQAVLRRNIADSFVNLGRRNQNLLGRQLDFITELESNETDPETLASLFRLDHLATRMRRNAESLLVLAGIEPPRKWAAPVRITDVIRAALGEVEDYQRVTIRGVEPATILGSAAADLAHLLAEFMENALTFSPPDQKVEVRGRHNHQGGYSLAVIDQGFGMPETDITQANRRLAGTESFTIAPSKYLGHYVAGNLAARHGIRLQLSNAPGHQGITAAIELPGSLLTTDAPTGDPITDPHGNRAIAANAAKAKADAGGAGAGAAGSPGSSGGEPGAAGPDAGLAGVGAGGWGAGPAGDPGGAAGPAGFAAGAGAGASRPGAPPFSAGPVGLVAPTGAAGHTDIGSGPPGGAAGRGSGRSGTGANAGLGGSAFGVSGADEGAGAGHVGGPGAGTGPGTRPGPGGGLPGGQGAGAGPAGGQDAGAGVGGGQGAGAGLTGGPGVGTGPDARRGTGADLGAPQGAGGGLPDAPGAGAGWAGDRGAAAAGGPGAGAALGGRPGFRPDPAGTAGAGAAPFGAGAGPGDPASEPGRTPSGLVKRSRRGGEPAAGRTSGTVPTGELLAALSTHTSRLGGQRRLQQPAGGPASGAGPGSPGRPALPSRFGDAPAIPGSPPGPAGLAGDAGGSPGRPALPSRRSAGVNPPSSPPPPGFPAGGPGQAGPSTAPAPGPAPGAGAAARPGFPGAPVPGPGLPGGPAPSGPGLPGAPGPAPGPGRHGQPAGDIRSGEWAPPPDPLFGPPGPGDRSSDAVAAFLNSGATQAVSPTVGRGAPAGPPPAPRPDPASGGTTRSGLARRVRGAQMPTTQPVSLRRRDQADGSTGSDPAKDVYSFLSNFTAGVQRGLDEARHGAPPEEK